MSDQDKVGIWFDYLVCQSIQCFSIWQSCSSTFTTILWILSPVLRKINQSWWNCSTSTSMFSPMANLLPTPAMSSRIWNILLRRGRMRNLKEFTSISQVRNYDCNCRVSISLYQAMGYTTPGSWRRTRVLKGKTWKPRSLRENVPLEPDMIANGPLSIT